MTKEQIAEINKRLEDGQKLTDDLLYKIWTANQGLIISNLNLFNIQQEDIRDTIKLECDEALFKAIHNFDPSMNVKFSTFATTYIKQEIKNQLKKIPKDTIDFTQEEFDAIEDTAADIQNNYIQKENLQESYNQYKQILLGANKKLKDIEIYLYWRGFKDGNHKSVAEISKIYKRKISSLNKLFASCNRILREHFDPQGLNKKWSENAVILQKDLILMNYIIECNKLPDSKILEELKEKYPNRKTILQKLTCFGSVDAISDSISRLIDLKGCKIIKENQWQGYHITNADEVTKMTNQEIVDISIILSLMEQYKNTPLEETFKKIWEKICSSMLGIVSKEKVEKENFITVISDPLASINEDVFDKVLTACRQNQTIEFLYHSQSSNQITERKADPYHIVYHDGSWYLLAKCHKSNKFLWFAFPRFKDITIKEKFTPEQDFDLEKYFDRQHGILWQTELFNVQLKFPNKLALYAAERNWGDNQSIEKLDSGQVIVKFSTRHEVELLRLIMKFSPDVEVLAPQSIRQKVKQMATATADLY